MKSTSAIAFSDLKAAYPRTRSSVKTSAKTRRLNEELRRAHGAFSAADLERSESALRDENERRNNEGKDLHKSVVV